MHSGVQARAKGQPDGFLTVMGAWMDGAKAQLGALQAQLAHTRRLYIASARRLGIDAGKDGTAHGPEMLFGMLDAFRAQWLAAARANAAAAAKAARDAYLAEHRAEQQRQKEARRAEREAEAARRHPQQQQQAEAEAAPPPPGGAARGEGGRGARGKAVAGKRRLAKLPFNRAAKAASAAQRQHASGAAKTCKLCMQPFKAWGDTCVSCRRTKRSEPKVAQGDQCSVCKRKVYDAERLVAAGRLFHKKSDGHPGCFRCHHCGLVLTATNFSTGPSGRLFFCPTHFRQLFATHGNYNFAEGAAEEDEPPPQQPAAAQGGDAPSHAAPAASEAAARGAAEGAEGAEGRSPGKRSVFDGQGLLDRMFSFGGKKKPAPPPAEAAAAAEKVVVAAEKVVVAAE